MFKVICIKQGKWECAFDDRAIEGPKYGEECIVESITPRGFYYLKGYYEIVVSGRGKYNPKQFIPLSKIDETEFVRNYNTEKV